MRIRFFDRKIIKLLGFLIIIIGFFITIFLVKAESIFEIIAGPGQNPRNIQITNISDISFSISYLTNDKVIGTLKYGTAQDTLDKIALDDRDQLSQSINSYRTHSITVKDLSPETAYYFIITSGDEEFSNEGRPFEIKTGSITEYIPSFQKPISGRVITPSGQAPEEGLVFVSINGASKLSTLLKTNGTYVVPLNNLRNESLNNSFKIEDNTIINIEIISDNLFSSVDIYLNQISPVPVITLSNNYDFSSNEGLPATRQLSNEDKASPTLESKKEVHSPTSRENPSAIITSVNGVFSLVTGIFSFLSD